MDVDIDNEFDGKFLDAFRSMGTTDRDVLIKEFQSVLGNQINPDSCAFFLDMNNWNLQNAVCSYYDFQQPTNTQPSMTLIRDMTVGDGESVAPNTTFVKTWKIKNSGVDRWPPGCHLRFSSGDNLSNVERRMVDSLGPGQETEICLEMKSSAFAASYYGVWRMSTPTGQFFGDVINVHVVVAEGGLLGLTQQLARIQPSTHSQNQDAFNIAENMSSMETTEEQQKNIPYPSVQMQPQVSSPSRNIDQSIDDDTDMS